MDQNEFPLDPRHVGVPLVVPKMIFEPMVCLTQTMHLSCIKAISEPMVDSAQTMHLSCIKINTVTKQNEMRFHLYNVIKKYHRVCIKRFPCLNRAPILGLD
jgi:hypothetical protein